MATKFCLDCRLEKPLAEFHRNKRNLDGLGFYCARCANDRQVASRRRRLGPPKHRGAFRPCDIPDGMKWCAECNEIKPLASFPRNRSQSGGRGCYCGPCFNRVREANRAKNHGSIRNYHLKHRYGIITDDFDRMFAEQDGLCAICREAPAAHVDHDHKTERVRGLLCFNCNGALGQVRDRADLMLRAVGYLRHDPLFDHPALQVSVSLVPVGRVDETPTGEE